MGLITKEVEVKLGGSNISYYENLGYEIPRRPDINGNMCVARGTTIMVSIDDLQQGSGMYVDLECDYCHSPYKLKYQNYNRHNHDGKTYCKHCFSKMFLKGKNNPNYNPNKTDEERIHNRDYTEYTNFIKRVLARDNYTCQCCGQVSGDLEVHHLDGYSWCIEKRTDDTNGITLCNQCHKSFHSIYNYGNNTKQQFEEWIGYTIELIRKNIKIEPNRKIYCYENDFIYNDVSACAKDFGVTVNCIYDALSRKTVLAAKKHVIWHDKYLKMSNSEKTAWVNTISKGSKVICITCGTIFNMIKDGCTYYKVNRASIIKCCQGKRNYAGKFSDGTPLKWMYYEDFLKLPIEEQNEILESNKDSSKDGSFVNYKNNESEGMINNVN